MKVEKPALGWTTLLAATYSIQSNSGKKSLNFYIDTAVYYPRCTILLNTLLRS